MGVNTKDETPRDPEGGVLTLLHRGDLSPPIIDQGLQLLFQEPPSGVNLATMVKTLLDGTFGPEKVLMRDHVYTVRTGASFLVGVLCGLILLLGHHDSNIRTYHGCLHPTQ